MASAEMIVQVKDMQRSDPEAKLQWWAYCDENGEGIRDPARHDDFFIQTFIDQFASGDRLAEPAHSPSGKDRQGLHVREPFRPKTIVSPSVTTAGWYYLDRSGGEYGPFRTEEMQRWWRTDHFGDVGERLLVRLAEWPSCVPLHTLYPNWEAIFDGLPAELQQPRRLQVPNLRKRPLATAAQEREVPPSAEATQSEMGRPKRRRHPMDGHGDLAMDPCAPHAAGGWDPPSPGYLPPPSAYGLPSGYQSPNYYGYGQPDPGYCVSAPTHLPHGRYLGLIKSFDPTKGFGFIDCPEAHEKFRRDVFIHKRQLGPLQVGTEISFTIETNEAGHPQARDSRKVHSTMDTAKPHRYVGRIRSYDNTKAWGFIDCAEAHETFGRDVFINDRQVKQKDIGTAVTFTVSLSCRKFPQARNIRKLAEQDTDLPALIVEKRKKKKKNKKNAEQDTPLAASEEEGEPSAACGEEDAPSGED